MMVNITNFSIEAMRGGTLEEEREERTVGSAELNSFIVLLTLLIFISVVVSQIFGTIFMDSGEYVCDINTNLTYSYTGYLNE